MHPSKDAPKRYAWVYDVFLARGADQRSSDLRINELLRKNVLAVLGARDLTRYALCKVLHLNIGNVHAYLAGDSGKGKQRYRITHIRLRSGSMNRHMELFGKR